MLLIMGMYLLLSSQIRGKIRYQSLIPGCLGVGVNALLTLIPHN